MNTLESKIDLLIGVVQDLKATIDGYTGLRPPAHKWISSNELARLLGMSQRSVLNLVHQGCFPEKFIRRTTRGKYEIFKFNAEKIIRFVEDDNA